MQEKKMILPSDAATRKGIPITTGVLDYFPLALAEVAKCSKAGNDQHNPGKALHWDKSKSTDHADCIPRHLIDRGSFDTDGIRHSAKLAWRALALLQIELEQEQQGSVENPSNDDGWIKWSGESRSPVDEGVDVEILWNDGIVIHTTMAPYYDWTDAVKYKILEENPTTNNDWIKWIGGECPVHEDTTVEYKMRGLDDVFRCEAKGLRWSWSSGAGDSHFDEDTDIVEYRVVDEAT